MPHTKFELTDAGNSKAENLMQTNMRKEDLSDVSNLLVVHYISSRQGVSDEQYENRLQEYFGGPNRTDRVIERAEDQGYVAIYRTYDPDTPRNVVYLEDEFGSNIFGTEIGRGSEFRTGTDYNIVGVRPGRSTSEKIRKSPAKRPQKPTKKNWNQLRTTINKNYAKAKVKIDKEVKDFKAKWKADRARDTDDVFSKGSDEYYQEGLRPLADKSDKLYGNLLKEIKKLKEDEDLYNRYGR